MIVYVCGPMTGYEDFNAPAFFAAEAILAEKGHSPINPAALDKAEERDHLAWTDYLRRDLRYLLDCDGVALLSGWSKSKGARFERWVAEMLGLDVRTFEEWTDVRSPKGKQVGPTSADADMQFEQLTPPTQPLAKVIPLYPHDDEPDGDDLPPTVAAAIADAKARLADEGFYDCNEGCEDDEALLDEWHKNYPDAHGRGVGIPEVRAVNPDPVTGIPEAVAERLETDAAHYEERRVVDAKTGGAKGQKLAQLGALDPAALFELAEVAGFGGEKYARYNYLKGYDWSLSFDALLRHALQFWQGEDRDPESNRLHATHIAWHGLALSAFVLHGLGTDDRPPTASRDS